MSGEMKIRYCRKCGARLKEGYKFCIQCGAPVNGTESASMGSLKYGAGGGSRMGSAAKTSESGSVKFNTGVDRSSGGGVKFNTGFGAGTIGGASGAGARKEEFKREEPHSGVHFNTDTVNVHAPAIWST